VEFLSEVSRSIMPDISLRFVHLTDTHIHANPDYGASEERAANPHTTQQGARALVEAVNRLPFQPDFILHTGDVAYDPDESAYVAARDILSALKAPVYYVPGNHDDAAMLQRIVVGREPLIPYDYEFEVNGVQIVVVDSNQPFQMDSPSSRIADVQIERLHKLAAARDERPLIVATHHNVLPISIPWWDAYMRMQNGEEFHMALLPAQQRLMCVLHGHVHMQTQVTRDGITYSSAMSSWFHLDCQPGQSETVFDKGALPAFNVCTVVGRQMYIRQQTFEVKR
jgi:3',5'-cyclic AMP phosphodiesterase CpdA